MKGLVSLALVFSSTIGSGVDQESVAQGMSNLGAGAMQGIPVSTSLSASSLNDASGAKTPPAVPVPATPPGKPLAVQLDAFDVLVLHDVPASALGAAGLSRVRPVVLGAATTILGVIPLVQDAFWVSMAMTIMALS